MATDDRLILVPGELPFSDLHAFWRQPKPVEIAPSAWGAVEASAETVARIVAEDQRVYGVNTGFGLLAKHSISRDQVHELQRRLVLSHCAGVGEPLEPGVVRLVMLLKAGSLARGYSGIRKPVIELLVNLLNADAYPVIPSQGSVGASGDLAPLAAMSAVLIGEGEVFLEGERLPGGEALDRLGLEPVVLEAKEGLALLNGTQVSTALALDGLFRGLDVFAAALYAGAMSVDAALGSDTPFDPRIHEIRGQPGQIAVAGWLRHLLDGSRIRTSHLECDRVQDPYSLRCQPQVMGAAYDLIGQAAGMLAREANAVSDNPLVFSESGEILSGGNFHAEPVAFAADMLALALSEVVALSERRVALLTDAHMSSLPAFLIAEPGLNSGFMIAHITAAALAAETKTLATPAVVDSLPTSANQEDHVSMATHGARRLRAMSVNAANVVAIELLASAQGIDLRAPLATAPELAKAHRAIRERAATLIDDRPFSPDVQKIADLVVDGFFYDGLWPNSEADLFLPLR
jgi:histidine ammonia-lyase